MKALLDFIHDKFFDEKILIDKALIAATDSEGF